MAKCLLNRSLCYESALEIRLPGDLSVMVGRILRLQSPRRAANARATFRCADHRKFPGGGISCHLSLKFSLWALVIVAKPVALQLRL